MDTWTRGHSRLAAVALQLLPGIVLPLIGTAGHAGKGKKWVWWQIFKKHHMLYNLLSNVQCRIFRTTFSSNVRSGTHWQLQLHTQRSPASLQSSWRRPGHPQRRRACHWVYWRCSPAPRSQHQRSQWQTRCNLWWEFRERKIHDATKLEEQHERRLLHILKADKVWPFINTDRSSRPSSELHTETTDLPSASLWRLCWRRPETDRQWAPRALWGFLSSLPPLLWRCFSSRAGWLDLSEQTEQTSPITPNIPLWVFSLVFSVVEKQQQTSYLKQHVYYQRMFYYADLTSHHLFWLKKSLVELQVCHCGLGSDGKSELINFQLQSPVWQTLFWEEARKSCNNFRGSPFTVLSIKAWKKGSLRVCTNCSINHDERTWLLMPGWCTSECCITAPHQGNHITSFTECVKRIHVSAAAGGPAQHLRLPPPHSAEPLCCRLSHPPDTRDPRLTHTLQLWSDLTHYYQQLPSHINI